MNFDKFLKSIVIEIWSAISGLRRDLILRHKAHDCCGNEVCIDDILNMECFFVLSTGRAGTKLLTKILVETEQLWVEHAPYPELAQQSYLLYKENISIEAKKVGFLHARLDLLRKVLGAGLVYVESNNRVSLYADAIAQLFPNAKFVHLVRHPAEFVRSGMRRGYYDTMIPEHSGHLEPRKLDPVFTAWGGMDRIEKIAWQWNTINCEIDRCRGDIDNSRWLQVRSDDLYSGMAIEGLFEFLDIDEPIKKNILDKLLAKPLNRQKNGIFPQLKNWPEEYKEKVKRHAVLAGYYGFEW